MKLPRQSRKGGGKTKLTNHRAARILHVIGVLSRNRGAACRGDARDPVQLAAVDQFMSAPPPPDQTPFPSAPPLAPVKKTHELVVLTPSLSL